MLMICPGTKLCTVLRTLIAANLSRAIVVLIMLDLQTRTLQAKEKEIEGQIGYM